MSRCFSLSPTSGKVRVTASADTPSTFTASAQLLALHFGNTNVTLRTFTAKLHILSREQNHQGTVKLMQE